MRRLLLGEVGVSWSEYIRMPYSAAMAAIEGYIIRTHKMDANFRYVAWTIISSFADPKSPKFPQSPKDLWPLVIDKIEKDIQIEAGPSLAPGDILKFKQRLCQM